MGWDNRDGSALTLDSLPLGGTLEAKVPFLKMKLCTLVPSFILISPVCLRGVTV